jgi:hypothetical protein
MNKVIVKKLHGTYPNSATYKLEDVSSAKPMVCLELSLTVASIHRLRNIPTHSPTKMK